MKQIYILIAILFLNFSKSNSQVSYVEIGENPYSYNESQIYQFLPTTFTTAKVQFLLTNEELTGAGLSTGSEIVGIQWYVEIDDTPLTSTYDLYVDDDYTASSLSSDSSFPVLSSTLVGDDLTDSGQSVGWHTANFTTPFFWDGTDNFVIQMCRDGGPQSGDDTIQLVNTGGEYRHVTGYYNESCTSTSGNYSLTFRPFFRLIVSTGTLTTTDFEQDNLIKFYPNPSSDFIQISGLTKEMNYTLHNILGAKLSEGTVLNDEKIDVQDLTNGLYFLKFENGSTIRFLKN